MVCPQEGGSSLQKIKPILELLQRSQIAKNRITSALFQPPPSNENRRPGGLPFHIFAQRYGLLPRRGALVAVFLYLAIFLHAGYHAGEFLLAL